MPLIYVTGPSGAGKSTVCNELVHRGYEAHDTDEHGLSEWYEVATGKQVERPSELERTSNWYETHEYWISPEKVRALAKRAKSKLVFLCGIPANDLDLIEYYDKMICLVIDTETMKKRIAEREANTFGNSADELKLMLYWHDKIVERRRNLGAITIDATRSIDTIINQILDATNYESSNKAGLSAE